MEGTRDYEDLIAKHRKEKKDLIALTQKKKHNVIKADKKKKKEVNNEIAQMLADLDLKHAEELANFQGHSTNEEIASLQHEGLSAEESASNACLNENSLGSKLPMDSEVSSDKEIKDGSFDHSIDSQNSMRISKAQKRRNRKAEQAKKREEAILEQEVINVSGVRSLEMTEIAKKLSKRGLMIHEIPSDGNCLYNAVEHQLSFLNLKNISMKSLRLLTANYLRSHKEEYLPFIEDPVTGDIISDEKFENYCNDVAFTSTWGGHVEVQVLSKVCGVPIEIIQAEGPSIITGHEQGDLKLLISFHRHVYGLGAHYNSVVTKVDLCD